MFVYIGECWCHIQNAGSVRHIISKVILHRRRHMHRKYLLSPNDLVARRAIVHTSAYKYGYDGKGASPRRRFTCKLMFVQKTLFCCIYVPDIEKKCCSKKRVDFTMFVCRRSHTLLLYC